MASTSGNTWPPLPTSVQHNHMMSTVLGVFFDNSMSKYLTIPELRCLGATEPLSNRVTVRADGRRLLQSDLAIRASLSKMLKAARGDFVKVSLTNGTTLNGILLKYSRHKLTLRMKLYSGTKDNALGGTEVSSSYREYYKGLDIKFTQLVDVIQCRFSYQCICCNNHGPISTSQYQSTQSFLKSNAIPSPYETQMLPAKVRRNCPPITWSHYENRKCARFDWDTLRAL